MNNTRAISGTNPAISFYHLSKAESIAFASVFTVASFFIVAGNFLTIVLFTLSKRLRKRSLFLVMNMAVSDLLLGAVPLPIFIFVNGDYLRHKKVKTKQNFYFSHIFVDTFLTQASLISAVFISLERFHAICWPFRHRVLSMRTYKIVIINYLTYVFELSGSWLSFASITTNFLNYFNSCVNPMVYAYRVPEFRQASRLCCFDKREQVERSEWRNTVPTFQVRNNQLMETEL
ncbi:histamine H2 receptor-like [Acropora millepora]|uniref:histamine H2 receptor-like n=1 Tax=Acropora millepora TaxID=45264 RepID=UPI001CF16CED|nr:histamine H2 receptor-like [Acropora millepora]